MQTIASIQQPSEIARILKKASNIAVVGLSPKENRPSNMVARYLLEVRYTIYPVNPGQEEILGHKCYPDLKSLPHDIDIVDIFRKSEDVLAIVEEAIALPHLPMAIWMQQGIRNEEAASLAESRGIYVVMDRCIKIDHAHLISPQPLPRP
jgi:uncharacterized protein